MVRINKYLADCGISSRRKSEALIEQGRVEINGNRVKSFSVYVDETKDLVTLDGETLRQPRHYYILLNKPRGVISSTKDERNRQTVIDLIKLKERIYPIGRLDYNTTGVLLLTNDGDFSQLLLHPRKEVVREYEVKLDRELEREDRQKLLDGVWIRPRMGRFTKITSTRNKNNRNLLIECTEGRNHFIKKMFEALDYKVLALNRVSFAGIKADIPIGSFRNLSTTEIQNLKNNYSGKVLTRQSHIKLNS
jgi:23S rRNA pseudouridine2605 synthase